MLCIKFLVNNMLNKAYMSALNQYATQSIRAALTSYGVSTGISGTTFAIFGRVGVNIFA